MTEAPALNGAARSPQRPPPPPSPASTQRPNRSGATHHAHRAGGRLKFFKDGKFILELARSQDSWVSVPKKTYWPPPAPHAPLSTAAPLAGAAQPAGNSHQPSAPVSSHHRLERAPSLSVSDDNSSIQSSPWQRDQRWKQSAPQRSISKELAGMYVRPAELPAALLTTPSARRKRRRPFDVALPNGSPTVGLSNGTADHSPENGNEDAEGSPKLNSSTSEDQKSSASEKRVGKFKFFKQFCESVEGRVSLRVYKKCRRLKKRTELCKILEILNERLPIQTVSTVTTKIPLYNCKQEHMMVSPRKRILRELERVSLEDKANKRPRSRATTVTPKPGPSQPPSENCNAVKSPPPQNHYNGSQQGAFKREPSTSKASSYSINSLLSKSDESPPRRSPDSYPAKKSSQIHSFVPQKTESPVSVHSPDLSSSPDASERHRSLRHLPYAPHSFTPPSHSSYASGSPRTLDKYYQDNYVNPEEQTQVPYQVYVPPYLPTAPYLSATYPPYAPRAPMLWSHYPVMPPGIWAPLPHPLLTDRMTREDTSSDVPLNLSKH